jgi:hypothetical protein
MTEVCYTAKDSCGSTDNCCFNVVVREEGACDTKTIGCMKYDILSITANAQQRYTYRIRVTNNCSNKLSYTAIQLPDGVTAVSPATNTIYESPEGRDYLVRNPNFTPFYSIRFKTTTDSIANGQSTTFQYTLPAQNHPTYIHIMSRLEPQVYYEAHLNTFNCPIGVTQSTGNRDDDSGAYRALETDKTLWLYPNPTSGLLFADVSDWAGEQVALRVFDARGQMVQFSEIIAADAAHTLQVSETLPNGLYFLEMSAENGDREVVRFVVER